MAEGEGIGGAYRISGIRNIGPGHVFPKSRVKKAERRDEEKREGQKGKRSPGSPDEKEEGVDITV